ncbi:DNA polymerase III subunit delta' [Hydrogenophaga sp. RWCD_12]|uniref:DNA polymerase III subunit delta' n=1 Tax=Hydrogenophaga sp. RWCD_12 TaxID=3391190 RepID=UPI003984F8B7
MSDTPIEAPWLARQRERLLAQRGHAWLLQGPSGLGQYILGLSLAQAWLCQQPTAQGACGVCDSCHLIGSRSHPDLVVLMPETEMLERGWPLSESAQKEVDDKKRKPSKEIRVEAMRDMVGFAQRTSARGRGTAVLVYPAERMNTVTANALLKTLEEPAGDTRFVLASESAHQLLPTIRSRCQSHVLTWPSEDEALAWLQNSARAAGLRDSGADEARVWLQAAGGRPEDALDWARAGLTAARWSQLPQALVKGDWSMLDGWPAAAQLATLQKLCHDLMAVAAGASPRFFSAASLPPAPRWGVLARWSKALMEAARTVEHPYNAGLMQEAWVAATRQVLTRTAARG